MKGASRLARKMDDESINLAPWFGFLQSLFQKNRPWGEAGHLLLCLGLVGKDADVKGLAVDALIEGIEGRVFDPRAFVEVMTRLCEGQWVKLNRLSEGLLQVAQVSALHARVVSEALQAWLPLLDLKQRGVRSTCSKCWWRSRPSPSGRLRSRRRRRCEASAARERLRSWPRTCYAPA